MKIHDSLPTGASRGDTFVNVGEGALGALWDVQITVDGNPVDLIKNKPTDDVEAGDLVIYDGDSVYLRCYWWCCCYL